MHKVLGLGFALVAIVCATGCGGDDDSGNAGNVSQSDSALGETAVKNRTCTSCHGADLSGTTTPYAGTMAYPANLTPDSETGIGDWDEDTIAKAILTGIDDEGAQLCPTMPVFQNMGMTDAEAHAIAKYLKTLAPVSKELPESSCPPVKGGGAAGNGT